MRTMELKTADGRHVARDVRMACSFTSRWSGRFRRLPSHGQERVLLVPCRSVHTIGRRCAIDVVFLTSRMKIIGLEPAFPPWRFKLAPAGTRWMLQLEAGQIAAAALTVGTFIVVEHDADIGSGDPARVSEPLDRSQRRPRERLPIRFSLRLPLGCHRVISDRDQDSRMTRRPQRASVQRTVD